MSGGPVPVYKKYTQGSRGIWEKIRQLLVLVPNRSSGNPIVPLYRVPPPGQSPTGKDYEDPGTIPASDIQQNLYFNRDSRRNYPKISVFDQTRVSGLLKLGTATEPRVSIGNAGEAELQVFKQLDAKFYLSSSLKEAGKEVVSKQILGVNGVVVAPTLGCTDKKSVRLVDNAQHGMYSANYPCRIFNYH